MIRKLLVSAAVCAALSGCGAPRIEGTDEAAYGKSLVAVRNSLSAERRAEFDKALQAVTLETLVPGGNLLATLGQDTNAKAAEARAKLDGKTADEVIVAGNLILEQRKVAQRAQVAAEIAELQNKKLSADEAMKELALFKVTRSRFRMQEQPYMGPQPVVELSVENGTKHAVARAFFVGTIASPGRSVPWLKEDFNYSIKGGLEPGETVEWILSPNMFSAWGKVDAPADSVLTVEVVRLDGADGKALFDAKGFDEGDQKRLETLIATAATLN